MRTFLLLLHLSLLPFPVPTYANEFAAFFARHKAAMQSYMMTGAGPGWRDCDIISLVPLHTEPSLKARSAHPAQKCTQKLGKKLGTLAAIKRGAQDQWFPRI